MCSRMMKRGVSNRISINLDEWTPQLTLIPPDPQNESQPSPPPFLLTLQRPRLRRSADSYPRLPLAKAPCGGLQPRCEVEQRSCPERVQPMMGGEEGWRCRRGSAAGMLLWRRFSACSEEHWCPGTFSQSNVCRTVARGHVCV